MPEKKDPYAGPSQKVIGLFGLLLFTGRAHSLIQLADTFQCSKQTVLRMVEEVERSGWLELDTWMDGGRRYYQARRPRRLPDVALDADALGQLMLCRDMVWHLLPAAYRNATSRALQGATVLLPEFDDRADAMADYVHTKPKGMIDYTGKEDVLTTFIQAIRQRRLCEVRYQGPAHARARTYTVAPYQLIIFHEGLYVRCRLSRALGKPDSEPDRTLAIHRVRGVKQLSERFTESMEGDVRGTAGPFGMTWDAPFTVTVRVVPSAAMYVRERVWSDDQVIEERPDGGLDLTFTSTSRVETVAWVLSFGGEMELRHPAPLREHVQAKIAALREKHG